VVSFEQAYYTRAHSQRFTGQSGFGVSGASGWFTKETADRYISSIGKYVFFTDFSDWMYMILPSTDGRLSVTRGFQTQSDSADGRVTAFLHTYLSSPETTVRLLNGELGTAAPARFDQFCKHYVGDPVDLLQLERLPSYIPNSDPADFTIETAGFTREGMLDLLDRIVLAYEKNRAAKEKSQYKVFVVYNCNQEEFESQAFALMALLYASLPYVVTSRLGTVIKTDNKWRSDLIVGDTAYQMNFAGISQGLGQWFIPGVDLFILNEQPDPQPTNGIVFTVSGKSVSTDIRMNVNPAYKELFYDILDSMDDNKYSSLTESLLEFYGFLHTACKAVVSFSNVCTIYQMTQTLRHTDRLAGLEWSGIGKLLHILCVCFDDHFSDAEGKWHNLVVEFFLYTLNKPILDGISEGLCIQLFDVGIYLCRELAIIRIDDFCRAYYLFLKKGEAITPTCNKLMDTLSSDEQVYEFLLNFDARQPDGGCFLPMCDKAMAAESVEDLLSAIKLYDRYLMQIRNIHYPRISLRALYNSIMALADEIKISESQLADGSGLIKFVYKTHMLAQIKNYKPEYITFLFGNGLVKIIDALIDRIFVDEMPTDLWAVLYCMYLIREGNERPEIWEAFERGAAACVESAQKLAEYREFIYNGIRVERISESGAKHLMLKYYKFDKPLSVISWNSLLSDIFAMTLPNERLYYFFMELRVLWGRTPINYDLYMSLYNKLRKMVMEEGSTESGIGNQLMEMLKKERSRSERNNHILLMLEGLYAVADTLNALWDNSAVSIYCPRCDRLNAHILSNSRLVCRYCNAKLSETNLGIYVIINHMDAKVLHSAIHYEISKKSLFEKVFKTRDNSTPAITTEERETYYTKIKAKKTEIKLIKNEFTDVCEKAVELIQQEESSRNTCFIIQSMQDGETQEHVQSLKHPFVSVIVDETDELPGYYGSANGYVKHRRDQAPKLIIKDLAIHNALITH